MSDKSYLYFSYAGDADQSKLLKLVKKFSSEVFKSTIATFVEEINDMLFTIILITDDKEMEKIVHNTFVAFTCLVSDLTETTLLNFQDQLKEIIGNEEGTISEVERTLVVDIDELDEHERKKFFGIRRRSSFSELYHLYGKCKEGTAKDCLDVSIGTIGGKKGHPHTSGLYDIFIFFVHIHRMHNYMDCLHSLDPSA